MSEPWSYFTQTQLIRRLWRGHARHDLLCERVDTPILRISRSGSSWKSGTVLTEKAFAIRQALAGLSLLLLCRKPDQSESPLWPKLPSSFGQSMVSLAPVGAFENDVSWINRHYWLNGVDQGKEWPIRIVNYHPLNLRNRLQAASTWNQETQDLVWELRLQHSAKGRHDWGTRKTQFCMKFLLEVLAIDPVRGQVVIEALNQYRSSSGGKRADEIHDWEKWLAHRWESGGCGYVQLRYFRRTRGWW